MEVGENLVIRGQEGLSSMKSVLFVIPYLYNGGAERALSNITTHFPKDWEIDILVNSDKVKDYPFRGNILSLGIDKEPRTSSVFFQFGVFLKRVAALYKLKRKGRYCACISFLDSANIANILSGKKYCKTLVSVRASLLEQNRLPQYKYIVNPLVKIFYNHADRVVAVSEGIRKELTGYFGIAQEKVVTIENGYDILHILKRAEELLQDEEKEITRKNEIIITSGRLAEQKAQWHLIRAFSEIAKSDPDVRLLILGIGPLEQYLKQLAEELYIADKVIFVGFTDNPYKYIAQADVFVLPSLYEGFPNALAEAVCLGIPCIATDFHTGAREILAPELIENEQAISHIAMSEFGIITPVCSGEKHAAGEKLEESETELVRAMEQILYNPDLRRHYAAKSRERSKDLAIENVIQKWIEEI